MRPITERDLYRRYFQLGELVSGLIALDGIATAAPVGAAASTSSAKRADMVRELGRRKTDLGVGSNAWGLGGDATDNGKGAVVGNPHFPWAGSERFYQSHVTVPGQLDVSGGTLYGVPAVLIGHTKGLAWSHTVATAWRLTPFELKLVPGDPYTLLPGRAADEDEGHEADGGGQGRPEAHAHRLRDRARPHVHLAAGPAAVPLDGDHRLRDGRRERRQLPLPQPLPGDQQGADGAPVRRHPAPLPGHPVGELAGRGQQGRGLLLDERRDPERAQRQGAAVPDRARDRHLRPARAAHASTARARSASGARRPGRPTRACCPTPGPRRCSGATTWPTATTATG